MAKSDYVLGGQLEQIRYLSWAWSWIWSILDFPFIANPYILMIIDLSLNIELKIHYVVDVDAIKAHVQDKNLS